MQLRFTESDLKAFRLAVVEAEAGSPGEIVVFVVRKSSAYEQVLWRGGAAGLVIALILWALLALLWPVWGAGWLWSPGFTAALFGGLSFGGAALAQWNGAVFRFLAGETLLVRSVNRRAQRAFLEEGVAETAARTGILLFVSVQERRIEVIADKGITAVVPQERWTEIVDLIRSGLRKDDLVGGLRSGIGAAGAVLRESGITATGSDKNELRDDVRFEVD